MSRAQLTVAFAAIAFCAVAPRLMAQDTSSTTRIRPDTSGYTGVGGVDTAGQPGRVAPSDTAGGATDTLNTGATGASSGTGMASPSSDSTSPSENGIVSDSSSVAQPTKQPGQSTSRAGSTDSTSP